MDNNSIIIWIDENGKIISVNDQACAFFKLNENEFLERNYFEFIQPEYKENIKNIIYNHVHNNYLESYSEISCISITGGENWLSQTFTTLKSDSENIILAITAKDITYEKNAYYELLKAKEFAEQQKLIEEKFIATIGHEIRTPMNAVIGLVDLLSKTDLDETQRTYLDKLCMSSDHILKIVNNLLEFKRIQSGKVEFSRTPFSIATVIEEQLAIYENQISDKDIKIIQDIDNELPALVIGDDMRLGQILQNLISNSIKYTHKGYIKITAQVRSKKYNDILVNFTVEDTGIGIPEENIKTIFDVYKQVENRRDAKIGTGLGLNIVKSLIEQQDGCISVNSTPLQSTTFSFTLPYKITRQKTEKLSQDIIENNLRCFDSVNLLLIDDDPVNIYITKKYLETFNNINLYTANDGEEGFKTYIDNNIDIVLTDINMPILDGYELTDKIRKLPDKEKHNVPIIALTADISFHDKLSEHNLTGYLAKPFTRPSLYQLLYETLGSLNK